MSDPSPTSRTSRLILGAMGLGGSGEGAPTAADVDQAHAAVDAALEAGITMVDHADIYGGGRAEQVFGTVLRERPGLRERLRIQTKCGITFPTASTVGHYDFSGDNVRRRVEASLTRLGTDRVDVLLLHRPDPLADTAELADALTRLTEEGLVGAVGVSNMSGAQMAHLQDALPAPLVADQLELSLKRHDFVESHVLVNNPAGAGVVFPHGTLEYCARHGVEVQAWGPLAQGRYSGAPADDASPADRATADLVGRMAAEKGTSAEAVVLAWLMRHPARIRPVVGTTNPDRIRACADADRQAELMTRAEWYALWTTARGAGMP